MGMPDPVAALAAQVRDLRGIVVEVKARMDRAGMSGSVKLHEQVAELARTVAALADEGPAPRVTAPNWTAMDEAERADQLAALAAWADGFLRLNYPHALTRPCWASHAAAVWELSTLRAEWQRVYDRKHPDLAGALPGMTAGCPVWPRGWRRSSATAAAVALWLGLKLQLGCGLGLADLRFPPPCRLSRSTRPCRTAAIDRAPWYPCWVTWSRTSVTSCPAAAAWRSSRWSIGRCGSVRYRWYSASGRRAFTASSIAGPATPRTSASYSSPRCRASVANACASRIT